MLEYDVTRVMSWDELMAEMKVATADEEDFDMKSWQKEYVKGKGAWVVAGEMDATRYLTKSQAYLHFLLDLFEDGDFLKWFKEAKEKDLKELSQALETKDKFAFIRMAFEKLQKPA
jgi:hypothetical protein